MDVRNLIWYIWNKYDECLNIGMHNYKKLHACVLCYWIIDSELFNILEKLYVKVRRGKKL